MANGNGHHSYQFQSFRLDTAERLLLKNGEKIALTPKAFDVLVHLVERNGHLVEKEDLMQAIWPDSFVEESNLTRTIYTLRKTLGEAQNGEIFIQTIAKSGYRFVAPVENISGAQSRNRDIVELADRPDREEEDAPHANLSDVTSSYTGRFARLRQGLTFFKIAGTIGLGLITVTGIFLVFGQWFLREKSEAQFQLVEAVSANQATPESVEFYWEMSAARQVQFIRDRTAQIQILTGDDPVVLDERFVSLIKVELDDFVSRNDSVSDRPFREPIKRVYERAAKSSEEIADYFESVGLSGALGIYLVVAESEYHQCLTSPTGSVGLFQLTKKTARLYDLHEDGYCHIGRSSEAASRYMADIAHEMAAGRSAAALSLLSYNVGVNATQEYLRHLRRMRIWEKSAWAILRNKSELSSPELETAERYLARFFAAAVVGETPSAFGLSTPPLYSIRTLRHST